MKIVIIGGVAGGASAATRLRRMNEDNEIIMFERSDYISFANCGLPYHIGETIKDKYCTYKILEVGSNRIKRILCEKIVEE